MKLPDRETIQRLWKIKKLVRKEFDITIQIDQKDLESTLIEFAQKTTNASLEILISQLITPNATTPLPKTGPKAIADNTPPPPNRDTNATEPDQENTQSKKKQIIYRGRTVSLEKPA